MNRAVPGIIALAIVIAAALALLQSQPQEREGEAFHVILAEPGAYPDGVHEASFGAGAGEYRFAFVPNGSSPQTLSISLSGPSVDFARDFELVGTRQGSAGAEYYTWDYEGEDYVVVQVPEEQEISIMIDPNGNVMGSVSVFVLEN